MRVGIAALASLVFALLPASAFAHHVVSESGISWVEPLRVAEVELAGSRFELGSGQSGFWQTMALRYEQPLVERISVSARVPFSHIDYDDGRRVVGLGDVEVAAKASLVATNHGELLLSAGLGSGVPTGVVEDGLGSGHVEIAPFVALSTNPWGPLLINAVLVHKESVGGGVGASPGESHGAVVGPHTDRESTARLELVGVPGALYGKGYLAGAVSWVDPGSHSLRTGVEIGYARRGAWRVNVRLEHPLAGWQRSRALSGAAFAIMF